MIRRLLGIGIVLVAAIIGYNLYFGTAEEKENAREIVNEVKNIGKASWDLLKSEKEKMEGGKYDGAADKLKNIFDKLRGIAKDNNDTRHLTELEELEAKRKDLERRLEEMDRPQDYSSSSTASAATAAEAAPASKVDLQRELLELYKETERIMAEMDQE